MRTCKIATRGSSLALIQSKMVIAAIEASCSDVKCELVRAATAGDLDRTTPLEKFSAPNVFTDSLERMLLEGTADFAVHSAKDMAPALPAELTIGASLERGDARDVLISRRGRKLHIVGTSSPRREAQLLSLYPDCECVPLRGNVPTRLQKLKNGEYDAIILAKAGLDRLGLFGEDDTLEYKILPVEIFTPAPCQGIIAIEALKGSHSSILEAVNNAASFAALCREREILNALGSGCGSGVCAYDDGRVIYVAKADGRNIRRKIYESYDLEKIKKDFL